MTRGDGHGEADEGPSIERSTEPTEGSSTRRPGPVAVGLGVLVALLAGGIVGFVLGGAGGGASNNPDLEALCIVVGATDDETLDRLESGELSMEDPLRFRVGAFPPLARAASEADGAPEGLAETATQVTEAATRVQFDELRDGFEELRTYC